MILVFDVGNTETTIGLFDGETMRGHWRIVSGVERTADEFSVLLRGLLALDGFESNGIDGAAVGSVVPRVTESLVRRTSKLPATELVVPPNVIGRRTEDCIRAGVMFGQADAIDGIVRRIKKSWPGRQSPLVIATGGFAETFRTLCSEFDRVEPHLTLAGLQMAYAHLSRTAPREREGRLAKPR